MQLSVGSGARQALEGLRLSLSKRPALGPRPGDRLAGGLGACRAKAEAAPRAPGAPGAWDLDALAGGGGGCQD